MNFTLTSQVIELVSTSKNNKIGTPIIGRVDKVVMFSDMFY